MIKYTWQLTQDQAGEFVRKFGYLDIATYSEVRIGYLLTYKDDRRCLVVVEYQHDDAFFDVSLETGLMKHWHYNHGYTRVVCK